MVLRVYDNAGKRTALGDTASIGAHSAIDSRSSLRIEVVRILRWHCAAIAVDKSAYTQDVTLAVEFPHTSQVIVTDSVQMRSRFPGPRNT